MTLSLLRTALRDVADRRAEYVAASDALRMKQTAFDAENKALVDHLSLCRTAAAEAEGHAKALVEQHYRTTGEKTPLGKAAEVKEFTVYTVNEPEAMVWAKEKQLCLVPESLDLKAIQKLATVQKLPFVKITKEPRAQIAAQINPADVAEPAPVPPTEAAPAPDEETPF